MKLYISVSIQTYKICLNLSYAYLWMNEWMIVFLAKIWENNLFICTRRGMKDVYCTTSLWADDSMLHTLDSKIILQSHRYPAEQNKHLALPHMVLGPLWAHETFCKLINQPPLRTTPRSLMRPSRHKPSENSQYMTLRSYYVYPRVGLRSVFF